MLWNADGISFDTALAELEHGMPASTDWLFEQVGASRLERLILVDATGFKRSGLEVSGIP